MSDPSGLERYNDIMRLAFEGEKGIDQGFIEKFGRVFPPHKALIEEGELRQRIYWILAGEVYVGRRLANRFRVLSTLGRGEIIGEMSFFDRSVPSATVMAKDEVLALEFTRDNFREIFAASPQWTRRLMELMSRRVLQMMARAGKSG